MENKLDISHLSSGCYDAICFSGEITISTLLPVTAELNQYTSNILSRNMVVDLNEATTIDSNGIRMLINLDKKAKTNKCNFYIMNPSEHVKNILENTNMNKVFSIIDSYDKLESKIQKNIFDMYLPYTKEENGLHRLHCSCSVCGSLEVSGYLIDLNAYNWRWHHDDPFPTAYTKDKDELFDVFGHMPIVCTECYMASIRMSDFNILDKNDSIVFKSNFNDESKNLLSKSIKKRKKMVESEFKVDETFIVNPREDDTKYKAYELAELCIRTVSILNKNATPFEIGYLNYMAIQYAKQNKKEEYINNCRTWFTQTLQREEEISSYERVVSNFVLLVAELNLNKKKDAAQRYSDLKTIIDSLPSSSSDEGLHNPNFWFKQADFIWNKEIKAQSDAVRI
jgi:anti-sigma B factor antagonist